MNEKNEQTIKGNYNDQTNLVVRGNLNIGLNAEEVFNIVCNYCNINKKEILDEVKNIVKDAIDAVPQENRKMPDKRIFIPCVQQLTYSTDNEILKQTYKNLLSSSMDTKKEEIIHPSYVNIISQLNADEIKILNALPCTTIKANPLINLRVIINDQKGLGTTLVKYFSDIGYGICDYPQNICVYLENLERLSLIDIPTNKHLLDNSEYTRLENHRSIQSAKLANNTNFEVKLKYQFDHLLYELTLFGVNFIRSCN